MRGGESAQLFTVHAALISHYSPSFGDLYKGITTEDEDRGKSPCATRYEEDGSVHLRDVKPEILDVAMTWVYNQKLYKRVAEVQKQEGAPNNQQAKLELVVTNEEIISNTERATTSSTALSVEETPENAFQPVVTSQVEQKPREDTPISEIEASQTAISKRVSIDSLEELVDLYIFAETYEFPLLKIEIARQ